MLRGKENLGKLKETKLGLMLTNNRVFTPRAKWIDAGKNYCSMYTWGGSYKTE